MWDVGSTLDLSTVPPPQRGEPIDEKFYRDVVLRRWRDGSWSREIVRVYALLALGFTRQEVMDILLISNYDIDKYLRQAEIGSRDSENRAVADFAHRNGISIREAKALHRAADPAWFTERQAARSALIRRMRFHNALKAHRKFAREIDNVNVENAEDVERLANAALRLEGGSIRGVIPEVGETPSGATDTIRVEWKREFRGDG